MKKETEKKLLNIVKTNYEEIANHFDETRKKRIWPELETLVDEVLEDSSILDIGCGNGRLLEAFHKKIHYVGIDQSESLIKIAKERYPNNSFLVGDALNINKVNFKEVNSHSKFDYIFLIAVLQHIPGLEKRIDFVKNLKNVLNPKGKIIISNWNLWEIPKYKNLILKTFILKLLGKNNLDFGDLVFDWKDSSGKATSKRYYHAFTKYELKKIITKSGYTIEKIYKDKYNFYIVAHL